MKILKRHPGGILRIFSKRFNDERWACDLRINGRRIRDSGFASYEEAYQHVTRLRQAALSRHRSEFFRADDLMQAPVAIAGRNCKIGSVGACAEMIVCADLLRRGFEVFRSVSSNADFDLIAVKDSVMCRIECKSAVKSAKGLRFGKRGFSRSKSDVLALVFLRENAINYQPSILEWIESRCGK